MSRAVIAYLKGAVRSYAYLFFSNSIPLGLLILGITFFDLVAGLSGLIAIAVCVLSSHLFNFNRASLLDGMYTYNALMVGLALGTYYKWSLLYLVVLIIAAMLSLLLTVWINGRLARLNLPALNIPFLITAWVLLLGLFNFSGVKLAAKGAFSLQQWFPHLFSSVSAMVEWTGIGDMLHLYLRSLSATLFQYNDLAGIIIAVALLFHSRIAFALSIYGFAIGYGFYQFFEGDFTPLVYSYIGLNFILTAIALGGFFIVPSAKSHLLLLFVIPVTALLLSALHNIFSRLSLPLYSLPFNIIALLVIGALQMRALPRGLDLVVYQQFSPEENHYKHVYYFRRFAGQFYYHLHLPVMGEWRVSQGYEGSITHKDDWQHALDFDIADESGRTFAGSGLSPKDYLCYDLPVLAPAAGYIACINDGIRDNAIGDVNLSENWGNTVVIRHAEGLYTKLSHLKPQSVRVKEGAYVQRGEMIASCGNSGRSPEPHLHFQAQATPAIGSHTLRYPIAYFLVKAGERYTFHQFEIPEEGKIVRGIIPTPALAKAFNWMPGEDLSWHVTEDGITQDIHWSVSMDSLNRKYLWCHKTGAAAYFYNDGVQTYFTDFYGRRDSFLHHFYTAFQKVLLGNYAGVELHDWLLPQTFFNRWQMLPQDLLAPFVHFMSGEYRFCFAMPKSNGGPELIVLKTESHGRIFGKKVRQLDATMHIRAGGIERVTLAWDRRKITAQCAHFS